MQSTARQFLQFAILLALGVLLTWLAMRGLNWSEVGATLGKSRWGWLVLAILLTFLGHLSRALRWQLLIQSTGTEVRLWDCFLTMMSGYMVSLGLPRAGELSRCASLSRLSKAPVLTLGGTVVAERAVDVGILGILVLSSFWVGSNGFVLRFWITHLLGPIWDHVLVWRNVGLLGFAILCLVVLGKMVSDGRKQGDARKSNQVYLWAEALWQGLWSAGKVRRFGEFSLHTVVIWLSYYAAPLCSMLALGFGGGDIFSQAFYVFIFGSLAKTIPLPAGSMGAYHYMISAVLVSLSYSEVDGMSLAILNHGLQTCFYLVLGLFCYAWFIWLSGKIVAEDHPSEPAEPV